MSDGYSSLIVSPSTSNTGKLLGCSKSFDNIQSHRICRSFADHRNRTCRFCSKSASFTTNRVRQRLHSALSFSLEILLPIILTSLISTLFAKSGERGCSHLKLSFRGFIYLKSLFDPCVLNFRSFCLPLFYLELFICVLFSNDYTLNLCFLVSSI